ncbi:hypothetical protein DPM33_02940 [Mesorhizobium hawassense]|uniref:Uncharacterized protein n=1 Tax=Mesorhizobium hawassense TaxID=1209954 RepID=A0A330HZ88_9HYPH|nr:hypothetical protein [Mesorhizobium hawassense]RAZ92840.1 hypothetical protein DPM33_02940 [Mesorhizobium hawassense]
MKHLLPILLLPLLMWSAGGAVAETSPTLDVYVDDQNNDVFVAVYGEKAVELTGCKLAADGLRLLHLPGSTPAVETTLAKLQSEKALGQQASLPCPGTAFDKVWPATTPVWADLEASGNYYLPAPTGGGYYGVPTACNEIKTALAIRERLQLPGVLHGLKAPPALGTPLVLDCGRGQAEPPVAGGTNPAARWSLHRFETFLSAESTGDIVYVARYTPLGDNPVPSYLAILRLNGKATRDIVVDGGAEAAAAEAQLRALFGVPEGTPVELLGAEAVSALRQAVYADLCLADCTGYQRASASFQNPASDLGLTPLGPGTVSPTLDALGNQRLDWTYQDGHSLSFTGCPRLTEAMGLPASQLGDWMAAAAQAAADSPKPGVSFDCRGTALDTCVRRLNAGDALTSAQFADAADCTGRANLRIELPALTKAPAALVIGPTAFKTVQIAPAPGVARARLQVSESGIAAGTTSCILSNTGVLIAAVGIARLELQSVDLVRVSSASNEEVVGILMQGGALALNQTSIGTSGEGLTTVSRGITLCLGDLYAHALHVEADTLALQGIQARVVLSGSPTARSSLSQARYGAVLSSTSSLRADFTDVTAANPLVLRGAQAAGQSASFVPLQPGAMVGSGLQLERGSSAHFTTSTIAGFRCAVSFVDSQSIATLLLPGNDVTHDNINGACGPGRFSLIE